MKEVNLVPNKTFDLEHASEDELRKMLESVRAKRKSGYVVKTKKRKAKLGDAFKNIDDTTALKILEMMKKKGMI